MIFTTLIPLGKVAGDLRRRNASTEVYEDAIALIDKEVKRLRAQYPERFISQKEKTNVDQN